MYFSVTKYADELKAAGFTDMQAQVLAKKMNFFIFELRNEFRNQIKNEIKNIIMKQEEEKGD